MGKHINEEQISGRLRMMRGQREVGEFINWQQGRFLWPWNCLVSWLWWWIGKPT